MPETSKAPLLSVREKFGYSLGDFASDLFFMLFIYYGLFFYTDVFGIPAAAVGTMFLVTKLWDSVNDPMMGLIADRTETRWGKFRPFLIWMVIPFGVFGVLAFSSPDFDIPGKIVYAYITYTLMMMVYTAINIPYSALMGVMTPNSKDRTSLSSYRFASAFAGGIFVSGMTLPLIGFYGGGSTDIIKAELKDNHHMLIEEVGTGTVQAKVVYSVKHDEALQSKAGWLMQFQSLFEDTEHRDKTTTIWVKSKEALLSQLFYTNSGKSKGITALLDQDREMVLSELSKLKLDKEKIETALVDSITDRHALRGTDPITAKTIDELSWKQISDYLNPDKNSFVQGLLDENQESLRKDWESNAANYDTIKENLADPKVLSKALKTSFAKLSIKDLLERADNEHIGIALSWVDNNALLDKIMPLKTSDNDAMELEIDGNFYLASGFKQKVINLAAIFDDSGESEDLEDTAKVDWSKPPISLNVIEPQQGFQRTIMTFALIAMSFFLITFFSTKERVHPPTAQKSSVLSDLKDVFSNKPWIIVGVMSLFTLAQFCVYGGAIMYYFKYFVKIPSLGGGFMLAGTISNLAGVFATDILTKWMGSKKMVYFVNSMLTVPLMVAFYFLGPNDIVIMFILTLIGGLLSGPMSPIVWAMYADIADYSEWETGKRTTGLFFSAATFAQKMGWTLGGAAAGWMLAWYGFEANIEQSAETIHGIKMLMSWIPGAGCLIAGVLVLFYKLDDKTMIKIEKDLTKRRKKLEEDTFEPSAS